MQVDTRFLRNNSTTPSSAGSDGTTIGGSRLAVSFTTMLPLRAGRFEAEWFRKRIFMDRMAA
jgi:hypothetical protein